MRVFLPLKKKEKNDESFPATLVVEGDNDNSSSSDRETEEEAWWTEDPETEGLDPAALAASVEAWTASSVDTTVETATSVAAVCSTEETRVVVQLAEQPSGNLLDVVSPATEAPSLVLQESSEGQEEEKDSKVAAASSNNDSNSTTSTHSLVAAALGDPQHTTDFPAESTADVAVAPVAQLPSPPRIHSVLTGSGTSTPLPTHHQGRARKRRSPSPLGSLDSKPSASKKNRDSKPPARETIINTASTAAAQLPVSSSTTTNNNNNSNTMAGGNSRGGRKHWNGDSSYEYCVENNASSMASSSAGPEDVSTSDHHQRAEVDVRYTYRHENDPASARGDAPTTLTTTSAASLRVPPAVAASSSYRPNVASKLRHNSNGGDDDVREATSDQHQQEAEHHQFSLALKKQGLEIVEQAGDGNCLFRAISLQVYGDASMHLEVRHRCLDFMSRDKEHFSQFITDEPFEQYIGRKRKDGVHGNNPEIQATSELFNRPIEVFVPENGAAPLNIFHAEYKTQDAPIRLSYHDGNHYNAVIDPLVPTAGLGLGLPGLQPGLADKMQLAQAVKESDRLADQTEFERALKESQNDQLQRAIKESSLSVDHMYQNKAMSLSDCDATNFEIEQAVLESSLESFRTFEHGRKQASSSGKSGRRKRQASPPQPEMSLSTRAAAVGQPSSSVASMPSEARQDSSRSDPIPGAASVASASASVASAFAPAVASRPSSDDSSSHAHSGAAASPMIAEHYPQSVQELVMNGFELRKVVHAYGLVGDNFDSLLGFLMSTSGNS